MKKCIDKLGQCVLIVAYSLLSAIWLSATVAFLCAFSLFCAVYEIVVWFGKLFGKGRTGVT